MEAKHARMLERGQRNYWTPEEEEALLEGVKQHAGKTKVYATIKACPDFDVSLGRRSNQDLRKKRLLMERAAPKGDEPAKKRQRRVGWTAAEVKAVRIGAERYGARTQPWKLTREDPQLGPALAGRRGEQIRCKARSLAAADREQAQESLDADKPPDYAAKRILGPFSDEERRAVRSAVSQYTAHLTAWPDIMADAHYGPILALRSKEAIMEEHRRQQREQQRKRHGPESGHGEKGPWSEDEKRSLLLGVQKYGEGGWWDIKLDTELKVNGMVLKLVLAGRTTAKLRGKYAQMQRDRLSPLHGMAAGGGGPGASSEDDDKPAPHEAPSRPAKMVDFCRLPARKRYLGDCPQLVLQATKGGMTPEAVRQWLQRYPECCPVKPHELRDFAIDHIIPKKLGGHDHPCNYFLLEKSVNRHLGYFVTKEKMRIVGKDVWEKATQFAQALAKTVTNYSAFIR